MGEAIINDAQLFYVEASSSVASGEFCEDAIKCGEIILFKQKWILNFSCAHCGENSKKLYEFILHTLQHYLPDTEEQINNLLKSATDEENAVLAELHIGKILNENNHELFNNHSSEVNSSVSAFAVEELSSNKSEHFKQNVVEKETIFSTETDFEFLNTEKIVDFSTIENSVEKNETILQHYSTQSTNTSANTKPCLFCKHCTKEFKTQSALKSHTRKNHFDLYLESDKHKSNLKLNSIPKEYICEICGAVFSGVSHFKDHQNRHLDIRPFSCTECGKSFVAKSYLKVHMRMHTGERPYKCDICGNTYRRLTNFILHKRTHTNERPFTCITCNKSFHSKDRLRDHQVGHLGERPHACTICEKKFMRRKALIEHMKLHSDIKNHVCPVCSKAYAQRASLVSHLKSHNKPPKRLSKKKIAENT